MADKDIPTITDAATLDGTESVHCVQSGNSRETNTQDIADLYDQTLPFDNEAGTTYTTIVGDNLKYKRHTNAASIAITVADVVHAAGDEITFEQAGAGVLTFSAGGSLVLSSRGALVSTNGQYAVCTIKFITTSLAVLFGDLV